MAELRDFGTMGSYYPGMVDTVHEPDRLPSSQALRENEPVYAPLCRAAGIAAIDDVAWWQEFHLAWSGVEAVRATSAAECLLRMPLLAPQNVTQEGNPVPATGTAEIIQVLNTLDKEIKEVMINVKEDMNRRQLWLLHQYTELYGPGPANANLQGGDWVKPAGYDRD